MKTCQALLLFMTSLILLLTSFTCSPLSNEEEDQDTTSVLKRKPLNINSQPIQSRELSSEYDANKAQKRSQTRQESGIRPAALYESRTIDTRELKIVKNPPNKMDLSELFREEADDYPEEEIKALLRKTPSEMREFHNFLNTPLDPHANLTFRAINSYIDTPAELNEQKEEKVCRSVLRNIVPKKAFRPNSPPVYIPNDQDFVQVVQAEICETPNESCSYLQDSLPYGMESFCSQKYAYQRLLYVDPLEKRMATDLFRFPSCCTCHVRPLPYDLRTMANVSTTTAPPPASVSNAELTESTEVSATMLSARKLQNDPIALNDDPSVYNKQPVLFTEQAASQARLRQPKSLRNGTDSLRTTTSPSLTNGRSKLMTAQGTTAKPRRLIQTLVLAEDKVYTAESSSETERK